MKANELRIGNWVCPEKPYQIDANSFQNVFQDQFDEDPIPLTEEWLLKFGAQERKVAGSCSEFVIEFNGIQLDWDQEGGLVMFIINSHESICFNIKYVHQLQNLYFALTGEELEITEKL